MSSAKLILDGQEYELPVHVGSEGEVGVDIRKLRKLSSAVTFDSGYGNTGSCKSEITFIDGEKGILRYRGYPIEEVAEECSFVEVCHLLVHGHLPTQDELATFSNTLSRHTLLHEDMKKFFEGYAPSAHPMAILSAMVASLSTYYPKSEDDDPIDLNIMQASRKGRDDRGVLVQEVDRSSVRVSAQRSFIHREFPAHDVRDADRAVRGVASARRCAAAVVDSARGSRTELLDLDGSNGWFKRGESLCFDLGWYQCAVRAASRRRQPARHRDAGSNTGRRQRLQEVRRHGQGQGLGFPPDGFRPPRLQELRSARPHPQERG